MEVLLLVLLAIVLIGSISGAVIVLKKLQEIKELGLVNQNNKSLEFLNQNLIGMHERLDKTTESLNVRLDNAAKVIGGLKHELGGIKEIGRSISDFQAFLKSPKIRGNLGESILYDALAQVFSSTQYARQFKFKEGQVVDAVIHTSDGMIPIDSKFPMDAYQRYIKAESEADQGTAHREFVNAVRKHIRDISSKYILPQEGTVDFAVMYVPSEAMYFEVIENQEDLHSYADGLRILVVSPNIFSYFLKTIFIGIERARLGEQAQQIWEILKGVQKETEKFGEQLGVLSGHVTRTKNAMDSITSEYAKLSGTIDQIKLLK